MKEGRADGKAKFRLERSWSENPRKLWIDNEVVACHGVTAFSTAPIGKADRRKRRTRREETTWA